MLIGLPKQKPADLVSKYINLHGLVTFKGLSSDVNGKFTKYDGWGGTTDSTKINGAMVETGSIKAEQIAANAITAIKIAANAVTADKISAYGLSVLHKTTGVKTLEIDASGNVNLNVNSLQIASKDVPTKTEVTQSIKDLQIGGRNLLRNSNFLNGTFGWATEENCKIAAGPNSTLNEKNAYVLAIANTGIGRAYNNSRTDKYHLAKTQYTLQFKYKTDDSSPVTFRVGVADTGYIIGNITAPADNTWRKFTATYTAPMTGSLTIRIISGTGRILIGVPKLEYGNKATDWTPAPEDFQDDATTKANNALASAKTYADAQIKVTADSINQNVTKKIESASDETNDKLTELRKEINSNIEQTGEAIKSSVYEKVYLKDDVDTLLSSVNTEVEQTKTSWQVTFNQLVKQLNDYSDGSDAAFDEIRKYIRFEDGNILLGNSSSPLILRIRNDRIQFLQNGYEVAYISDQRMYNTTCEIINQLRIADSAWTVEYNASGDTVISLVGI